MKMSAQINDPLLLPYGLRTQDIAAAEKKAAASRPEPILAIDPKAFLNTPQIALYRPPLSLSGDQDT